MSLQRGDRGEQVLLLQHQLKKHNLDLGIDGQFGLETEAAVRAVQAVSPLGLTKNGTVGPRTQLALEQATPLFANPTKPVRALVNAPYFSQRDNLFDPGGTCNVTSLAMTLASLGVRPRDPTGQLEDELYEKLQTSEAREYFEKTFPWARQQDITPRNVHGMLLWIAKEYGYRSSFTWNATLTQLETHLKNHGPVLLSGKFVAASHIVALIGFTTTWDFIINDPWGNWEQGYGEASSGNRVIYNLEDMADILKGKPIKGKKAFMADLIYGN